MLVRNIEAFCHAESDNEREYEDRIRHASFNLMNNPNVDLEVVTLDNEKLAEETLMGRIQRETESRHERFQAMLQDKYDAINDENFTAIVKCRRCGSEEVTWEEKQTRSADEGATIFVACVTCRNRWVMRQ
jgi:DNA-directed RNA polymerase subunit M/transcription elongation factor TFIIS